LSETNSVLAEKFIKIVKNVNENLTVEQIEDVKKRWCPDQYVGKISELNENILFDRKSVDERPKDNPCIIMILESPHIDEFSKDTNAIDVAVGPANGVTGRNIRKYLKDVLTPLFHDKDYGLILMNAIQYQCSLGEKPFSVSQRDSIFRHFWEINGGSNFKTRLNQIILPNDVIFNCCTKGKGKQELRGLVQEALTKLNNSKIKGFHPASWSRNGKYRSLRNSE